MGKHKTKWICAEDASKCPGDDHDARCVHVGSQPRLCVLDSSKAATWKAK